MNNNTNMLRLAFVILAMIVGVLVFAWIDGGQEPLRPISQTVTMPETAR